MELLPCRLYLQETSGKARPEYNVCGVQFTAVRYYDFLLRLLEHFGEAWGSWGQIVGTG